MAVFGPIERMRGCGVAMTLLRNAMQSLRKNARFAQGAVFSRNWTHPEIGHGFTVILGAFSGLASFRSDTLVRATQVLVRQIEAASVASHRRARAG